jgi:hypothetical protein
MPRFIGSSTDRTTINYNTFNVTVVQCTYNLLITLKIFAADLFVFFCAPSPNLLSCLRASAATIVHCYCIHFSSGTSWELLRTELAANIPKVALYSLGADRTENSVVLLVSAYRTENISRGCYYCVATNCRRDAFTSALRSNKRRGDWRGYSFYCCVRYPATSSKHSSF